MPAPSIEETGHISYDVEANIAENQTAYQAWYKDSIKTTGKLELPGLDVFTQQKTIKVSRIDKALASMPPPKIESQRRQPQVREISPCPSEIDPVDNTYDESYEEPLNHGSIPDWDSDYAYKASKFRRNIDGDNF
jgi:hypothetical protein